VDPETQLNEKFRERLIHYQEQHDMTRRKLADKMSVSEACLSKWINQSKNWSRGKIMQVAYDLEIDIEDLLIAYDRLTQP
jgi:transcriptional regulator with XRE-family HTH domain